MPTAAPRHRRPTQLQLTAGDYCVAPRPGKGSLSTKLLVDFSSLFKRHPIASYGQPLLSQVHYNPSSGCGQSRLPLRFAALLTTAETQRQWAAMRTAITLFEGCDDPERCADEDVRRELLRICFNSCRRLADEGYLVSIKLPLLVGGQVRDITTINEKGFIRNVLNHLPMSFVDPVRPDDPSGSDGPPGDGSVGDNSIIGNPIDDSSITDGSINGISIIDGSIDSSIIGGSIGDNLFLDDSNSDVTMADR